MTDSMYEAIDKLSAEYESLVRPGHVVVPSPLDATINGELKHLIANLDAFMSNEQDFHSGCGCRNCLRHQEYTTDNLFIPIARLLWLANKSQDLQRYESLKKALEFLTVILGYESKSEFRHFHYDDNKIIERLFNIREDDLFVNFVDWNYEHERVAGEIREHINPVFFKNYEDGIKLYKNNHRSRLHQDAKEVDSIMMKCIGICFASLVLGVMFLSPATIFVGCCFGLMNGCWHAVTKPRLSFQSEVIAYAKLPHADRAMHMQGQNLSMAHNLNGEMIQAPRPLAFGSNANIGAELKFPAGAAQKLDENHSPRNQAAPRSASNPNQQQCYDVSRNASSFMSRPEGQGGPLNASDLEDQVEGRPNPGCS